MSLSEGVAISVAVLALVFSFWQGTVMRRHYRLSVKPHLFFDTKVFEGQEAGLRLTNGGTGPAIADTFHVWLDSMEPGTAYNPADGGWKEIQAQLELSFPSNAQWLERNQIVQPGESLGGNWRAEVYPYAEFDGLAEVMPGEYRIEFLGWFCDSAEYPPSSVELVRLFAFFELVA